MADERKGYSDDLDDEDLLARYTAAADDPDSLTFDGVMDDIDRYGIQRLINILEIGLDKFRGKQLLPVKVSSSLHAAVYNMCSISEGHALTTYEKLKVKVKEYLEGYVIPALDAKRDEHLLTEFKRRWEDHKIFTTWMRKMFQFMDKQMSTVGGTGKPCSTYVALELFKRLVFDSKKDKIVNVIQDLINRERNGEHVDRSLLRSVIELFVVMGCVGDLFHLMRTDTTERVSTRKDGHQQLTDMKEVIKYAQRKEAADSETYHQDFEVPFLKNTRHFYAAKAREWLAGDDTPAYLIKADESIQAEDLRVNAYLNESTRPLLLTAVEKELLRSHLHALLEKPGSGMAVLLRDNKLEDLNRMYRMFSRVPNGLQPMADVLQGFIKECGIVVITKREARLNADPEESKTAAVAGKKKKKAKKQDPTNDPEFVQELIKLQHKSTQLVVDQFANHTLFQKALKNAFEFLLDRESTEACSNAEVLCSYCDKVLKGKRGKEKLRNDEVEAALEAVACLFDYLKDKDTFAESYRQLLCKRLLGGKTVSRQAERLMLTKLKMRCGAALTQKMEGMFNNLETSKEAQAVYAAKWAKTGHSVEFGVTVLKTGFWPTFFNLKCTLPTVMSACTGHFVRDYTSLHSSRKLTWILTHGTATVRATYARGWKDINVTTLQAVVLLLFNEHKQLTFLELVKELGLQDQNAAEYTKRVIHTLSCAKGLHIISKTPKGMKVADTDVFTFNADFKHAKRNFNMPAPVLEQRRIKEKVESDRQHVIDATLVRIMKARKTLKHAELIAETLKQIKLFRPEPKPIKRRIASLIEREYLKRREGETGTYDYVA